MTPEMYSTMSLMKNHLLNILLGAIGGIFLYLYVALNPNIISFNCALAILCGIGLAYLISLTSQILNRLFPWQQNDSFRLLSGIFFYSLCSILVGQIFIKLYGYFANHDPSLIDAQISLKIGIILLILFIIFSVIEYTFSSYQKYSKGTVEEIQMERKQIDLQLQALKAQLNPHFLFNNLNTISSVLDQDQDQAENLIRKLASSYQYTLNNCDKQWITVDEEIEFVKSYYYLLQTRFGDLLEMNINISSDVLKSRVPPLSIQMLVENAVKHNVLSAEQALHISINNDTQSIIIKNNKTKRPKLVTSFHIGLSNIKERYKILADKNIAVIDEQDFTVKLPIVL